MFVGVVVNAMVKTIASELARDGYRTVKVQVLKRFKKDKTVYAV